MVRHSPAVLDRTFAALADPHRRAILDRLGSGPVSALAGRTRKTVDAVAEEIRAAGGRAETAELDAYDEQAVDAHADAVVAASGRLDISMNVVQHGDVQGTPLVEMAVDDFLAPVLNGLRNPFLTARAAARHMVPPGSGAILVFGGYGDPMRDYFVGGLQVGFQAMDSLAVERVGFRRQRFAGHASAGRGRLRRHLLVRSGR
jgi:NAD(P)-dependent dehydrogenase (short-subunit alcohol dehydrogenase family)